MAGRRQEGGGARPRSWTPPGRAVLAEPALRAVLRPRGGPLVVGGRSAGARVACRTAVAIGADLVVCLAFPLHPPGRPDRSRADELLGAGGPTLVVQGERDPFGGPEEVLQRPVTARASPSSPVPDADHGFRVPARLAHRRRAGRSTSSSTAVSAFLLGTGVPS